MNLVTILKQLDNDKIKNTYDLDGSSSSGSGLMRTKTRICSS